MPVSSKSSVPKLKPVIHRINKLFPRNRAVFRPICWDYFGLVRNPRRINGLVWTDIQLSGSSFNKVCQAVCLTTRTDLELADLSSIIELIITCFLSSQQRECVQPIKEAIKFRHSLQLSVIYLTNIIFNVYGC